MDSAREIVDDDRCTPISAVRRPEPPTPRPEPVYEAPKPILRQASEPVHSTLPGPWDALDFLPVDDLRFGVIGWIVIYIAFSIHKDIAPTNTVSGVALRSAAAVFVSYLVFKLRSS